MDATGSLICIMPVLLVVSAVAELISGDGKLGDVEVTEVIAGIVTIGIFVLMGIGLKKLGRKVALNKQKKEMEKQRAVMINTCRTIPMEIRCRIPIRQAVSREWPESVLPVVRLFRRIPGIVLIVGHPISFSYVSLRHDRKIWREDNQPSYTY